MQETLLSIDGSLTAFVAGLVASLHCAVMCGPIALILAPRAQDSTSFLVVTSLYQAARVTAFALGGAIAGALGLAALSWVELYQSSIASKLPWLLVIFFLLMALRLDRKLPHSGLPGKLWKRTTRHLMAMPRSAAAVMVGFATPLLPCGPLYMVFGLALMSQSPVRGAEFLLAFGLGTLPLLWLAQHQFHLWQQRVNPQTIDRIQRIVAALAAAVIALRLLIFNSPSAGLFCGG